MGGTWLCGEKILCVCVVLKLLGPSPGPQGVGLPTRETGAAQVAYMGDGVVVVGKVGVVGEVRAVALGGGSDCRGPMVIPMVDQP